MNETEVEAVRKYAIQSYRRMRRMILDMIDHNGPSQRNLVLHGVMEALARMVAMVGQHYPREKYLEILGQAYDEAAQNDKPRVN